MFPIIPLSAHRAACVTPAPAPLNPQAAADLLDSIDEEIGKLAFMPGKNRLVEDPVLAAWGIRSTAIRNYLAFYVIDEDSKTVHLVRFLYGRRNWISILRGEQGEATVIE